MKTLKFYAIIVVMLSMATSAMAQYVNVYSGNEAYSYAVADVDSVKVEESRPNFRALSILDGMIQGKFIGDEMVFVEGGTFLMGATASDPSSSCYDPDAADDESPVHSVTLSPFYIGKFEVTIALWLVVMNFNGRAADGSPMSKAEKPFLGSVDPKTFLLNAPLPTGKYIDKEDVNYYPVSYISIQDINDIFIPRLNKITGKNFRLPTEAEWEYAARGGIKSNGYKYSGTNNSDEVVFGRALDAPYFMVGAAYSQPNELGIYDMSGNVAEYCSDAYGNYSSEPQTNPRNTVGEYMVMRGGNAYASSVDYLRNTNRDFIDEDWRYHFTGFRLVCEP